MQRDATRWGLVWFVALTCAAILVPFALWEDAIESQTRAVLSGASPMVVAFAVIGLLAVDVVLPIPASLVMVAAAVALPPLVAFLSCFAGLMLSCVLGYGIGWRLGEPILARMATADRRAALSSWFARYGVVVVAACRSVPVLAELSVVMAGTARARAIPFLAVCLAANAAVAAIYVALGAQVSDTWSFLAAFAASCTVPALGWLTLGRRADAEQT
jgi:membrane protein DedA with SNARE-associated domain